MKHCITKVPCLPESTLPTSLGVIAEGKFLFVAGYGPYDPDTGGFVRGTIAEQTQLTLTCLRRIVESAGATMDDVVSCRVYLQQITRENFAEMNEAYAQFFPEHRPVRTTIGCQLLDIDVEIDCVVRIPS
jgi:2-iminobutanoate/2-iminopropanoate deaminase